MARIFFLLLVLASSAAQCATPDVGLVQISPPPSFEGPTSASENGGHVSAYVHRIAGSEHGSLLQITTYDFGAKLKDMPKEEAGNVAEQYLLQFLSGIERRRSNFHASSPTRLLLGGLPAARVEWTGVAQGQSMSGVMYCVIVGTNVVALHTQGFANSPAADRADALRAIESATFRGEG